METSFFSTITLSVDMTKEGFKAALPKIPTTKGLYLQFGTFILDEKEYYIPLYINTVVSPQNNFQSAWTGFVSILEGDLDQLQGRTKLNYFFRHLTTLLVSVAVHA